MPGSEPPCYLENIRGPKGGFELGTCIKLFLNSTKASDVQKLGFAIQKATALRELVLLEPALDSAGAGALGAGVARGGLRLLMLKGATGLEDS